MATEALKELYTHYTNQAPESIDEMSLSGSNRRYFRIHGTPTLIGVRGESKEENDTFIYMARHFKSKGLPVPEIYAVSEDGLYYLQQDLGNTLLFNAIEKGRLTHALQQGRKNTVA